MKRVFIVICFMFLIALTGTAHSLVITDTYGDEDGFNLGYSDGDSILWSTISPETDEEGFTDSWVSGDQSWTHTYDLSGLGTLTEATLEVQTAGQGWFGLTEIYIDGTFIGSLTDGDFTDTETDATYPNFVRLDTFNLLSFASYFDGATTFSTVHERSGDGWALDYSKLTLSDEGAAPVPEPGTLLLLGSGLAGLAVYRRKMNKA